MGIGQKKTPKSFVNACDLFIYTENLAPQRRESKPRQERGRDRGRGAAARRSRRRQPQQQPQQQALYAGTDPMPLLREAYEMVVQENGWANLGPMGKALQQLDPGFDPRSFGQRQLSSLIKSLPDFEMRREEDDDSDRHLGAAEGAGALDFSPSEKSR